MITAMQLLKVMPNAVWRVNKYTQPLSDAMDRFEIITPARIAAFVAQIAHESGELRYVRELWGPTGAQRMYDPPGAKSSALGNTSPGDGFKYRGRGFIQITGRANYAAAEAILEQPFVDNPELVEEPTAAALVSALFWYKHGCNQLADVEDFEKITRVINGGLNGYESRIGYWTRGKAVFV